MTTDPQPVRIDLGAGPKRGEIIRLGNYPFEANRGDWTPVEWQALDASPESLLLISRCILSTVPAEAIRPGERRDTAAKRWLNETLIGSIFAPRDMQGLIPFTPEDRTGGHYILLPSPALVSRFLPSREDRRAALTDCALTQGLWAAREKDEDGRPYGCWLLNGEEIPGGWTCLVNEHGDITRMAGAVGGIGLRPLIRVDRRNWALSGDRPGVSPQREFSND